MQVLVTSCTQTARIAQLLEENRRLVDLVAKVPERFQGVGRKPVSGRGQDPTMIMTPPSRLAQRRTSSVFCYAFSVLYCELSSTLLSERTYEAHVVQPTRDQAAGLGRYVIELV